MSHIFVLYAPPDHAFARQLAIHIEQRGMVVWPVPDLNLPRESADQDTVFNEALASASHVLCIVSAAAAERSTFERRCMAAQDPAKHVFVILHAPADIPAELRAYPVIDFRGQFLLAVEELIEHLNRTHAPRRPLTVEHPPPVVKDGLLPNTLPGERCWRDDRLKINYELPIIMSGDDLEVRMPAFFARAGFELVDSSPQTLKAWRKRHFGLFDPRRADHTLTLESQEGAALAYYKMTRVQVYHWFPVHYRVLDREAAALYRYLATGKLDDELMVPVVHQARVAQAVSVGVIVFAVLVVAVLIYLITI